MNRRVNRAERNWIYAAKSWGHSCKKSGKRASSKALRRLNRVITSEESN